MAFKCITPDCNIVSINLPPADTCHNRRAGANSVSYNQRRN
jgi:hypothetical protein